MKRKPARGKTSHILKGKNVLIADDDARNTFALVCYLKDLGFEMKIYTVESGIEAIDFLNKHNDIEIILMDMMMPEMDGYEAINRIKDNRATGNIPIIAVTARAMAGDREKCIQAGASDYISKPVDMEVLLEKMSRVLNPV